MKLYKSKTRAYLRAYHAKNRVKRNQQSAAYRARHPEIAKAATKRWQLANPEKRKKLWKAWSKKHRAERSAYYRRYYEEHKKEKDAYKKQWHRDHPLEARAHSAVTAAIRLGKLIRPKTCAKCGKPCKPEGHHHNGYAKEHWFDVIWLCKGCHLTEHY